MENNEFDKLLRDRLEGMAEPAPDVWEGISKGLDRRRRAVIFRRFSIGVAAAAAVVAIALLVVRGPQSGRQVDAPEQTAQSGPQQPVLSPDDQASPEVSVPEIAPIADQVAAFTRRQAVAKADVKDVKEIKDAQPGQPSVKEETNVEDQPAVKDEPKKEDVRKPEGNDNPQLSEENLPAGFWTEEDETSPRKHTSQISISSNLTTVAGENDLIYKASPMHSSSQTGNRASSAVEPVSESPRFFSPLSVGLQVAVPFSERLSLETGLRYTYLVSQYDMLVDKVRYEGGYNQLHYVGIPLSLSLHFIQTSSWGVYASAGGAVEKCVAQRYVFGSNTLSEKVGGLQWSSHVGLGVEYWFVPKLGIYFDPSLVYYFDNSQPFSIRTQQPLQARFEVGLRFNL